MTEFRNPPEGVTSVSRKALFADISEIETPDDHTVIFKLSAPNAFMEAGLLHLLMRFILQKI